MMQPIKTAVNCALGLTPDDTDSTFIELACGHVYASNRRFYEVGEQVDCARCNANEPPDQQWRRDDTAPADDAQAPAPFGTVIEVARLLKHLDTQNRARVLRAVACVYGVSIK